MVVVVTTGDSAVISGDPDRPCTLIGTQAFEAQTGMRGVLQEFLEGFPGGSPDVRWQTVIPFPETCRAARVHLLFRKDFSFMTRNCPGNCACSVSRPSSSDESAGRGDSSFKMASQPSAGNSPGQSAGISLTNWRRALAGSLAMASSISSSDFMPKQCAYNLILSKLNAGHAGVRPSSGAAI